MNKKVRFIKIIVIGLMLITAITILTGCGKKKEENKIKDYEEPVKNMIEGIQNTNLEQYTSAFPDFVDFKLKQTDLDRMMDSYIQLYGEDIKISYEIKSVEDVSNDKLSIINDNIKIYYESDKKVTKGYKLEVIKTIKGSKDQIEQIENVEVYEIEGKWKMFKF